LQDDRPPREQPVLPATRGAEPEALLLRRDGPGEGETLLPRLWRAPGQLHGGPPLWIGTAQRMRYVRPLGAFGLWRPDNDGQQAFEAVRADLAGLRMHAPPRAHAPMLLVETQLQ